MPEASNPPMAGIPDEPSFTVREAAEILGVNKATVYRYLETGELHGLGPRYFFRICRQSILKKMNKRRLP
ncbi:hypothetical protein W02_38170 [Nitrospira sp. KM1]|uniref:helix-turn-helix domain-containing protein n=1 Tax=Nitrospira sp. KM1 TaxID=1936990 RepID=UPI0013A727B1|nr:helix-turn-helix domain-containing protein [Nitrospira sp. KM1]BCA56677.1 hypothetical protein W02_38170 [Nitrospira sp. KM1]